MLALTSIIDKSIYLTPVLCLCLVRNDMTKSGSSPPLALQMAISGRSFLMINDNALERIPWLIELWGDEVPHEFSSLSLICLTSPVFLATSSKFQSLSWPKLKAKRDLDISSLLASSPVLENNICCPLFTYCSLQMLYFTKHIYIYIYEVIETHGKNHLLVNSKHAIQTNWWVIYVTREN